jgi:hypothetical protein
MHTHNLSLSHTHTHIHTHTLTHSHTERLLHARLEHKDACTCPGPWIQHTQPKSPQIALTVATDTATSTEISRCSRDHGTRRDRGHEPLVPTLTPATEALIRFPHPHPLPPKEEFCTYLANETASSLRTWRNREEQSNRLLVSTPLSPHTSHLALELHQQPPPPPFLSESYLLNEETRH